MRRGLISGIEQREGGTEEQQRREILIASNVHSVNGAENGGIRYVSALVHRLAAIH